jgi:hypothetical protein
VIVEQLEESGKYTEIVHQSRTENFIELSLSRGRYRYRVSIFNLLDKLEYTTNWANFSIDRARPPSLAGISSTHFTLNGKKDFWAIDLDGINLIPESEITLRPVAGGKTVKAGEYTSREGENSVHVVFPASDLTPGKYELSIKNPGGFETTLPCSISGRFPLDVFVSASYAPAVPVYGYLKDLFNGKIQLPGFSARISFLSQNKNWGSLGVEALAVWDSFSVTKPDLAAAARLFNSHLNLLYQYSVSPPFALCARAGIGQTSVLALSYDAVGTKKNPVSTWMLSACGGLSLKWIFVPHAFAELGLDYMNLFSVDGNEGILFPHIGIGWKY